MDTTDSLADVAYLVSRCYERDSPLKLNAPPSKSQPEHAHA